jgi:hypothetical protein
MFFPPWEHCLLTIVSIVRDCNWVYACEIRRWSRHIVSQFGDAGNFREKDFIVFTSKEEVPL